MIRFLLGIALLPSSGLTLWAAARTLGRLVSTAPSSYPFLAGLALGALGWLFGSYCVVADSGPAAFAGSLSRRVYVLGHELTHALAAWSVGAKVHGFHVAEDGGHVDLSHSNAFIALAPYCVPIYTVLVVAGYRAWLWLKPGAGAEALFLALMGLSLSFHLVKTAQALWETRQPDLAAAGGAVFSLAWISLANGLLLLLLLKALFPGHVGLSASLHQVAAETGAFWAGVHGFLKPLQTSFVRQMK